MRHVWTALCFERTILAVADRGEVTDCVIGADVTSRGQHLAGWTSVDVLLLVKREVGSAERAVLSLALVPHRNVRRDTRADEPTEELARPVRPARDKTVQTDAGALIPVRRTRGLRPQRLQYRTVSES